MNRPCLWHVCGLEINSVKLRRRKLLVTRLAGPEHSVLFQFNGQVRSAAAGEGNEEVAEEVSEPSAEAVSEAAQRIFLSQINR